MRYDKTCKLYENITIFHKKITNKKVKMNKDSIKVETFNDKKIYVKNNIVQDKTCPNCKVLITDSKSFCDCGFYLKANQNSKKFAILIPVWILSFFLSLILIINLAGLKNMVISHLKDPTISTRSLSPLNIQVINNIKNKQYRNYIQNAFVSHEQGNKLVVIIKPNYWNILSKDEKQDLRTSILKSWQKVYKASSKTSTSNAIVELSNK